MCVLLRHTGLRELQTAHLATPTQVAAIRKRIVSGPSMISNWDSSKVSFACSQIATGTTTTTCFTSTATSYSDSVISTVYSTVDALGSITTSIKPVYIYSLAGITVTTQDSTVTSTTTTSCPLQTQVSCFTLTGHGRPHIDGRQLYLFNPFGIQSPIFGGWGNEAMPAIFYLQCEGYLVSLPWQTRLQHDDNFWPDFEQPYSDSHNTFNSYSSKCVNDEIAQALTCDGTGWFSLELYPNGDWGESYAYSPVWGLDSRYPGLTAGGIHPIALTYEDVPCECDDPPPPPCIPLPWAPCN